MTLTECWSTLWVDGHSLLSDEVMSHYGRQIYSGDISRDKSIAGRFQFELLVQQL